MLYVAAVTTVLLHYISELDSIEWWALFPASSELIAPIQVFRPFFASGEGYHDARMG